MLVSDVTEISDRGYRGRLGEDATPSVIITTIFHEFGTTGVHTHFHQVARYLMKSGANVSIVTPFSWGGLFTYGVFSPRPVLQRVYPAAAVVWYRHWHEVFLRNALRRRLAAVDDCVVYAQGPLEARAALMARRGPHQRVIMAVHFRGSQADEHTEPGRELEFKRDGRIFRSIRKLEREVILKLDGIVYVAEWARQRLLNWLPEAETIPSAVIGNFVDPLPIDPGAERFADLVTMGKLEDRKNHRFLLEVLRHAKDAGQELTLDIFGDGPLRRELEQLAGTLGLAGQVRFRGFRSDVRDFLPRYRAYVHAAYAEVLPLAVIEGMAAGLPVVAADSGGVKELFDDGVEGRFWSLDDPRSAAQILLDLLSPETNRAMVASAALDRFHREYDVSVLGPQLKSFLLG
jgi:glycosyltransferase involved in cell wall biosynthesis